VNWVNTNVQFLPFVFLCKTLKEVGAASIGLIAPYLPYMRQDIRFKSGEVVTSKIFASMVSASADWLVTVDPHLHRYQSLDEIYSIPSVIVQGAPLLARWLADHDQVVLVGPDAESVQWVESIAAVAGHPFVIGAKTRLGDRHVEIALPDMSSFIGHQAVIIDDVISSGQTLLKCIQAIKSQGIISVSCAAVHGIFADDSDKQLMNEGLTQLITTNTIPHHSNVVDMSPQLSEAVLACWKAIGIH